MIRAAALLLAATLPVQEQEMDRARVLELMQRGDYAQALATAQRADLHLLVGRVRQQRGEWDAARSAYERASTEVRRDSLAAELGLATLELTLGDTDAARARLDGFIDLYNRADGRLSSSDLAAVATAVRYLSRWDPRLAHDALRAYDEAIAHDSTNLEAHLGVGELFLERYAASEAARAFRTVLSLSPDHARGLLGLARTHRFANQPDAAGLAGQALEANPGLVDARTFLARLHLEREDHAAAEAEVRRALEVNPSALDALSVLAAVHFLADDTAAYDAVRRRVFDVNPHYADLYVTLAEAATRQRRYADAVALADRAIALDSTAWRGWAMRGINQLRTGAMAGGRTSLERAFAGDPFDLWAKNTLDLLDTLEQYDEHRSARFRYYVDGKESAVLALYFAPLAEEAYEALRARYGHEPPTPIRIEVFPTHADFSVRTVGLAGLGALGVSFGPVIAMDSPSARDRGAFNWGSTLWHEIAHTFHLSLSRHRVPRWFTEGLAVLEERRARPGWGDDVSPGFLFAWRAGQLRPPSRLNDGFLQPRFPQEVGYSYYLGSLVCEFIEARHGADALRRLLVAFGDGLTTSEAVRNELGLGPDGLDAAFTAWLRTRFAGPLAALADADTTVLDAQRIAQAARREPGNYLAQLRMGHFLVREGRQEGAVTYFERARELFPAYAGADSPYPALAELYGAQGEDDKVLEILAAWTAISESAWDAHLALARARSRQGDAAGAARALDAAMYISPLDLDTHEELAALYRRIGDHAAEVRERRAVLALDPPDRAAGWYRLAEAHLAAGAPAEARSAVLRALEIAPGYAEAQDLLLAIVEGGGTE